MHVFRCGALALSLSFTTPIVVAEAPATSAAEAAQDERARVLLDKAVARLARDGERALAAFSMVGEFTDGELYVYALDSEGTLLASGGASYTYVGRNMLGYRDPDGKALFADMLDGARRDGGGRIDYRWLNMQRGSVERKTAYYRLVDKYVLAVGYYTPRASQEQAMSTLWRAIDELKRSGPKAFDTFNDINGGYVRDDTYVFVVGLADGRMLAHGAMPRLVGRRVLDLKDADGEPIIRKMIELVERDGEGTLAYRWPNPVTGQIENKKSFLHRVGDYLVAVGYYQP